MCAALATPAHAQQPIGVRACSNPARAVQATRLSAHARLLSPAIADACDRPGTPALAAPLDVEAEVRAMSRYAGWGASIGVVVGVAYALVTIRGGLEGDLSVAVDGLAGFAIGVTGGSVVYVVRRTTGQLAAPSAP